MLVDEVQAGTSSTQFNDWIAHIELDQFERHREDFNFGLVVQAIYTLVENVGKWNEKAQEVPFEKCLVGINDEQVVTVRRKKKRKKKLTLKSKEVQKHILSQKLAFFDILGIDPSVLNQPPAKGG